MTFLSKLSPYGKYGAKMHAIQVSSASLQSYYETMLTLSTLMIERN